MKQPLDTLAERIGKGIDRLTIHIFHRDEMAMIWGKEAALTRHEKRQKVQDFAQKYGFRVALNEEVSMAFFKKLDPDS